MANYESFLIWIISELLYVFFQWDEDPEQQALETADRLETTRTAHAGWLRAALVSTELTQKQPALKAALTLPITGHPGNLQSCPRHQLWLSHWGMLRGSWGSTSCGQHLLGSFIRGFALSPPKGRP